MNIESVYKEAVQLCVEKFPNPPKKKPVVVEICARAPGTSPFKTRALGSYRAGKFLAQHMIENGCSEVWIKTPKGRFGFELDLKLNEPRFYADKNVAKEVL